MRARLLTVPAALLLALSLASCSDDGSSTAEDPNTPSDVETTDCTYEETGGAAKEVDAPDSEAPAEGSVDVSVTTTIGDLVFTLDRGRTPCTAHSFVSLAEQGYFDDTRCHRIAESISILQCGDPTATGTGGPGYSFADELEGDETYTAGTLAMANSGPDTNGSQFFIVYGDAALPPAYTVFGTVDEAGTRAVEKAAAEGTDNANGPGDGTPKADITIESVSVG